MNPHPVAVEVLKGYKLLVKFQNNERRIFDATPLLDLPLYKKLSNKGFFSLAKADGMCVYWNDEIDICPDVMYENSVPIEIYSETM